jgi:hypothetical protein
MATFSDNQRKVWLDAEVGTIRKQWRNRVRVALVYPNQYAVGMANLGFQTVYRLLPTPWNIWYASVLFA